MYSFSAIKDFQQCPKLYNEKRILKSVKFVQNESAKRGERLHKAFEDYVKHGTPMPAELTAHEPLLRTLIDVQGAKLTEYAMAMDGKANSVEYYDPAIKSPKPWDFNPAAHIGCVADLIIVGGGETAYYFDYKTGAGKYPDISQCELTALMMMAKFKHVNEVIGALLFVDAGTIEDAIYTRADFDELWQGWQAKIARIEYAKQVNVWQAIPSGLCGYCAVNHCKHKR